MTAVEQMEIDVSSAPRSGVAWGAIVGGALAAAAISLILMVLGSGLGLTIISPWTMSGTDVATIAAASVIWLIVVQWIASAVGGYLAGRMRSRSDEPADETFFRDTANGFLAWALATLLVAALLTSALSAIIGTGARVAGSIASSAAQGAATVGAPGASNVIGDPNAYLVDSLYRPSAGVAPVTAPAATDTTTAVAPDASAAATAPAASMPAPAAGTTMGTTGPNADLRAETGRILANGLVGDQFPAADRDYLAQRITATTGLSADEAGQRVDQVVQTLEAAKVKAAAAADVARKAAARLSLFMFASLLVGAFIAAAAAALGGNQRDEIPVRRVR